MKKEKILEKILKELQEINRREVDKKTKEEEEEEKLITAHFKMIKEKCYNCRNK